MDEMIWQEHTYEIEKQPDVGFGIAISGGKDNPGFRSGDPSIVVSDVVKHGPAFGKLQINDTVVRVNGRSMFNQTHAQAVKELKSAGHCVAITVKRKALVRVDRRDTPSPGPLRRSRSRDLDYGTSRSRHRSHSRDLDRHRSRSRGGYRSQSRGRHSRSRSRRRYSSSRSRTPPSRRGRSHSRASSRRRSRSRTPSSRSISPARSRRSRSRGRTPSPSRSHRSRRRSYSSSSRSYSPPRTTKHNDIRSMSPLSPDPDSEKARRDPDMMVFPVKASQPKPVVLKKTRWNNSYGLKLGTRIFVQDIQPGSLADKNPDISAGDTILMINGRNVDNKSVNEAIQIIGLSKDKLTMLVKKQDGGTVSIPADRFQTPASPKASPKVETKKPEKEDTRSEPSRHSSKASSRSTSHKSDHSLPPQTEVKPEPKKKAVGGVQVLPAGLGAAVASQAKNRSESRSSMSSSRSNTPEPAPRHKKEEEKQNHPEYAIPPGDEEKEEILPADAQTIKFIKGRNVGIRLAGGNDVGIFVASVQEGSPAARQGLKMGDQILSVNDVNFRNVIREEAVLTLMGLPAGEEVVIIAQPRPSVFQKILEHGTGDSFYVRTHFKYERAGDHEMSFKQGSIFRISDTLYQGMVGYWLAVRIGRGNMEIERGVIPNGSRAQQLKEVQDRKILQAAERTKGGGIGRRLMKNQKKGDTLKPSVRNQPAFPAYERVVLREAGFKRPAVIFGPLADISRQRLSGDYPTMYEIARNEGVVSGQKSNRKGVIRLNMIKDIIEKDKHAILDITPNAVEKLNYAQLYPIVVFLKPTSKGTVKELRSKLAVTEDERKKKPNKLYDRAIKMMKGYSHVFTDTIPLTQGTDDWYRKLYSTIKDQQNMPVWVSEDKLGGAEEDSEGAVIPGDDDRLSYVSAPASDYSVTTVGSEMLHSTVDDDESDSEVNHSQVVTSGGALLPPGRKEKKYSSSEEEEGDVAKFGDDDFDDGIKDESDEEPPTDKPVPPHSYERVDDVPSPHVQPRGQMDQDPETSSSSSEERRPPIGRSAAPQASQPSPSYQRSPEPTRTSDQRFGKQEIPEGRFDPQSFLKNHIRRLKQVHKEDEISSEEPELKDERIAPTSAPVAHQSVPQRQPSPEPQQPRYKPQTNTYTRDRTSPVLVNETLNTIEEKPQQSKPTIIPVANQQPWVSDLPPPPSNLMDSYENRPPAPVTSNYPLSGPKPYVRPSANQEPVYAQVNKRRPGQGPTSQVQPPRQAEEPQRESTGRDYQGEIDSFISNDPYRRGMPARKEFGAPNTSSRPPVRDEPQAQSQPPQANKFRSPHTPAYRRQSEPDDKVTSPYSPKEKEPAKPTNSLSRNSYNPPGGSNYNRFGNSQAPKSNYPYSSNKPTGYRPPASNGPSGAGDGPPRSRFVQDKYKDYMSQVRNPDKSANYSAKPAGPPNSANKFKNGPTKDQSYDSGVDTYDIAKPKTKPEAVPVSPSSLEDDDPQVVATARGVFDSNGGVLSSVETGVSIMIPKGAIPPGVKQEIYFKVCRDNTVLPPLDKNKGETLLSPLVMCGPHGLQFNHPVELRLPHCASMTPDGWSFSLKSFDTTSPGEPSQWQNMNASNDDNCQISSNSVSVLIDHF